MEDILVQSAWISEGSEGAGNIERSCHYAEPARLCSEGTYDGEGKRGTVQNTIR